MYFGEGVFCVIFCILLKLICVCAVLFGAYVLCALIYWVFWWRCIMCEMCILMRVYCVCVVHFVEAMLCVCCVFWCRCIVLCILVRVYCGNQRRELSEWINTCPALFSCPLLPFTWWWSLGWWWYLYNGDVYVTKMLNPHHSRDFVISPVSRHFSWHFLFSKVARNRRNDKMPWKSRNFRRILLFLLFLDTFLFKGFCCFCCFQTRELEG